MCEMSGITYINEVSDFVLTNQDDMLDNKDNKLNLPNDYTCRAIIWKSKHFWKSIVVVYRLCFEHGLLVYY